MSWMSGRWFAMDGLKHELKLTFLNAKTSIVSVIK